MRFYSLIPALLLACGGESPEGPKRTVQTTVSKKKATPQPKMASLPDHPGAKVYSEVCQACHQISGKGLGSAYPPLVGSEWLTKSDDILIRLLLHGLTGPIKVAGKDYGSMNMANNNLTDTQTADVLTFIRSYYGKLEQPVTVAQVKAVRDLYPDGHPAWTMETLKPFERSGTAAGQNKSVPTKTAKGK